MRKWKLLPGSRSRRPLIHRFIRPADARKPQSRRTDHGSRLGRASMIAGSRASLRRLRPSVLSKSKPDMADRLGEIERGILWMNRKVKREPSLKCLEHSSKQRLNLKILYRQIDTVKLDPANPRRHSKKQVRQIGNSIEAFGLVTPILIDRNDNVIAGHGRLLACRLLGITEVPTLCLDHLTSAQARAFMIADNRLTEIATWDDRLLAEQLRDLSLSGLDFDIEVTGFEMGEIDLRIAALEDTPSAGPDPADVLPEPATGRPISKIGDLWLLGRHRVLCGNALDRQGFTALMDDKQAAMVFTDPPYNVPIDGHASGLGAIHHRPFPMASGEMSNAEFAAFLAQ